MSRRGVLLWAGVALVLFGCGSSDTQELSAKEFRTQGSARCKELDLKGIKPEHQERFILEMTQELEALRPPPEGTRIVRALRRWAAAEDELARTGRGVAYRRQQSALRRGDDVASSLGMPECSPGKLGNLDDGLSF